jgi:hypothetical protein
MPEIKPPEIKSAPPTRSKAFLFVGLVLDDGYGLSGFGTRPKPHRALKGRKIDCPKNV